MKTQLKNSLSINKTLLILTLVCLLFGLLGCVLGEVGIPLIVGVLSALYLFDTKPNRLFSIITSLVLLGFNLASIVLGYAVSLFAPAAIIMSLLLASAFRKEQSKSDTAYLMTVIAAALSLGGYLLYPMLELGSYNLDTAIGYYTDLFGEFRAVFVDAMVEIYAASGLNVTVESVAEVFDYQLNMIISYLLIGGFIISGISMKIFDAIVRYCSEDKTAIKNWRFTATRIYGYFYVILVIASMFASSKDSLLAISVLNLYNVFTVVFAYIGFKVALYFTKKRRRPGLSAILLIGCIIIFSSFAMQLLSALGGLYTMRIPPSASEQHDK